MTRYGIVCVGNQMISSEFGINKQEKIFSKTNKIVVFELTLIFNMLIYSKLQEKNHVITYL